MKSEEVEERRTYPTPGIMSQTNAVQVKIHALLPERARVSDRLEEDGRSCSMKSKVRVALHASSTGYERPHEPVATPDAVEAER